MQRLGAPLIVAAALAAAPAHGAIMVTIQPSFNLADIVWTVTWDSLAGNIAGPLSSQAWNAMDPATGALAAVAPWGPSVRQAIWNDVGVPYTSTYGNGNAWGFGHGSGGVVSSPGGWGVGPDHDFGPNANELMIFNTLLGPLDPFPTAGSFVLTVPGANLGNYNIGVYTANPNATITVTATPAASPVPEPGTIVLVGLGMALAGLAGVRARRRRDTP